MANRYFGKCCMCGAEIVSFHSGLSPCNLMGCGGRGFCHFPAGNLTPLALDAAMPPSAEPDSGLQSVPAVEPDTQPRK